MSRIWVINGKETDIEKYELTKRQLSALEAALSEVHNVFGGLVVAKSMLPYGEMAYANEPSVMVGATVLKFPCGHEYHFGDKNAFVRPMCKECDAELAKKVRESPNIWFSKNMVKPKTALVSLRSALSTLKTEDKKKEGEEK